MRQGYRYQFSDVVLDTRLRSLRRNGEEIALPWLSYQLLLVLCETAPAIVSQQEIIERVWPDTIIGDETLKQRVKLLRKTLGDNAAAPEYIEVIRGRGYRLKPDVIVNSSLSASQSASLDLTTDSYVMPSNSMGLTRYWKASSAVFLSFLVLIVSVSLLSDKASQQSSTSNELKNVSFEQQLYQKGLNYYQRYRKQDNLHAIKLFSSAIELKPGFALAHAALADAYSQGVFQFNGEEVWKKKAVEHAYHAISLDPELAQGYKSLGLAYFNLGWYLKAAKATREALAKRPNYPEASSNLGYIYREMGQLADSIIIIKKALKLQPNNSVSLVHLSLSYMAIGDLEQADELLTKALLLQPDSLLASDAHGQLLLAKGKLAAARQHYQQQVRDLPTDVRYQQGLLQSLFMLNNTEQLENAALNLIHQQNIVLQDLGHFYLALLSSSHANQDDLALKLLQQLEGGSESAVLSWKVALLNAKLGQKERAKRYLSQAIHYGFSDKHKLAYFDTINPKVRSSEWQVFTKEIQAKKALQRKRLDL